MKHLFTSTAVAIALAASPAAANQITLGESTPNAWDIAGTGHSHPLAVSGGSFTTPALFESDLGIAHFGLEALDTSAGVNGVFPVIAQTGLPNSGETLAIDFADGDKISGHVDWSSLNDGSLNPHVVGVFDYTASGDAAFLASWGDSGSAEIDMIAETTKLTLENWDADDGVTWSSGEIVDVGMPVSEPASFGILAFGLLMIGAILSRGRLGSFAGIGG